MRFADLLPAWQRLQIIQSAMHETLKALQIAETGHIIIYNSLHNIYYITYILNKVYWWCWYCYVIVWIYVNLIYFVIFIEEIREK